MDDVEWFEDYAADEELEVREYDITATPNDFNVSTLFHFVEAGAVSIPGFQRNFVWDIKRSSKLIESLILGLPVPQLFLYEQSKNKFLVIDGQQRLMSIYYFIKQRYPKKAMRAELRAIFEENGKIPDEILHNDDYFINFRLQLPGRIPDRPNPFAGKSYSTLGDAKFQFDLRPLRNVVVRQNAPDGDDSSVFEIFSRLNSGGVNLRPQEIRLSLYHSSFYDMLMTLNREPGWRRIVGNPEPDLHLKDVEILLRIFGMLIDNKSFKSSMVKFLNHFSRKSQSNTADKNAYLSNLFVSFINSAKPLRSNSFQNKRGRFSIALIEAVFAATCKKAFEDERYLNGVISQIEVDSLANDAVFVEAGAQGSTHTSNVHSRLKRGEELITPL